MGDHVYCVFGCSGEDGYLGTFPVHDPARADRMVQALGLPSFLRAGPATLDDGLRAPEWEVFVGAYESGFVIGSPAVSGEFLEKERPAALAPMLELWPGARILAVNIEDACNAYSFAWFEGGRLRRRLSVVAQIEEGLLESGLPLPEEEPYLRRRRGDGEDLEFRSPDGEEWSPAWQVGWELAHLVSRRMFGGALNEIEVENLALERFEDPVLRKAMEAPAPAPPKARRPPRVKSPKPPPKGFLRRLFGG